MWAESKGRATASFSGGGGGGERSAQDVHATLCALVMTEAARHDAWADYAAVLLDKETAAFFAARLPEAKADPPSKKRKKLDEVEDITLRVACLDGSSLDLTVPPRERVRELKRSIGQVRQEALACGWCREDDATHSQYKRAPVVAQGARLGPGLDRALRGRRGGRPA
jgi:hypothetical protein